MTRRVPEPAFLGMSQRESAPAVNVPKLSLHGMGFRCYCQDLKLNDLKTRYSNGFWDSSFQGGLGWIIRTGSLLVPTPPPLPTTRGFHKQ